MSNVIRLLNGGTIQVRTGVLAGVGPEGPRGLVGPAGPQGEQGFQGDQGPIGQILQRQSRAVVSGTTTVSPDTDTLVAFGTVSYDDMGACTSSTNFTLTDVGDYQLNCYLKFEMPANAPDGHRTIFFSSTTNGEIARTSRNAILDEATYVDLSFPHRSTVSGEVIRVYARSGDDLSCNVTAGSIVITRTGSGPQGPQGPAGPAGPTGATGPAGPTGATGSASSGFATYADLL